MKVVVKLNLQESFPKFIYLDENEMWIKEADNKQLIDINYKDRFNTLLSLFLLKKEWNNERSSNPSYEVMFEDNNSVEIYGFEEMPDNFNMFLGYLAKLVGDLL